MYVLLYSYTNMTTWFAFEVQELAEYYDPVCKCGGCMCMYIDLNFQLYL